MQYGHYTVHVSVASYLQRIYRGRASISRGPVYEKLKSAGCIEAVKNEGQYLK